MSATNRGGERRDLDGYYTPLPLARAVVRRFIADRLLRDGDEILEPSVGHGAFVQAVGESLPHATVDGCDLVLRDQVKALWGKLKSGLCAPPSLLIEQDFLEYAKSASRRYDLIIGNPPYEDAEAHVRAALGLLNRGGALTFLLRLNFLSSKERTAGLYREWPLDAVYVLDKRPSFDVVATCATKCGWTQRYLPEEARVLRCPCCAGKVKTTTTDACEYGVFVWQDAARAAEPTLRWLSWSQEYDDWIEERKRA